MPSAAWWTRPEVAFVAVFLASDKAWAVSGELVVATGEPAARCTTSAEFSSRGRGDGRLEATHAGSDRGLLQGAEQLGPLGHDDQRGTARSHHRRQAGAGRAALVQDRPDGLARARHRAPAGDHVQRHVPVEAASAPTWCSIGSTSSITASRSRTSTPCATWRGTAELYNGRLIRGQPHRGRRRPGARSTPTSTG